MNTYIYCNTQSLTIMIMMIRSCAKIATQEFFKFTPALANSNT